MLPVYPFDSKYASDTDGFTFDLTAWLGDSDQISQVSASISPSDANVLSVVSSAGMVTVWVSGGTAPNKYTIELRVQTSGIPPSTTGRDCRVRGSFAVEA